MAASPEHLQFQAHPPRGVINPAFSPENPLTEYIDAVTQLVDADVDALPERVAKALCSLLKTKDWLPDACCEGCDENYCRHVLYADPQGRFTVLSLVWRPGQASPVHGHTAWGAVGVYRGNPSVATFSYKDGDVPRETGKINCCAGEVSYVLPGVEEPHSVFNASDDVAITIHTYGRDLTEDPCCINILI